MDFRLFLGTEDFHDLIFYVRCSRNNRLRYVKSEFDTVYEYYVHKHGDTDRSNAMKTYDDYIPVIVSKEEEEDVVRVDTVRTESVDLSSNEEEEDVRSRRSYGEEEVDMYYDYRYDDTMGAEGTERTERTEWDEDGRRRYRIYNINHPDLPSVSVPLMNYFMKSEVVNDDDYYESEDEDGDEDRNGDRDRDENGSNSDISNDEYIKISVNK